jgi:hypothetical protein
MFHLTKDEIEMGFHAHEMHPARQLDLRGGFYFR